MGVHYSLLDCNVATTITCNKCHLYVRPFTPHEGNVTGPVLGRRFEVWHSSDLRYPVTSYPAVRIQWFLVVVLDLLHWGDFLGLIGIDIFPNMPVEYKLLYRHLGFFGSNSYMYAQVEKDAAKEGEGNLNRKLLALNPAVPEKGASMLWASCCEP